MEAVGSVFFTLPLMSILRSRTSLISGLAVLADSASWKLAFQTAAEHRCWDCVTKYRNSFLHPLTADCEEQKLSCSLAASATDH